MKIAIITAPYNAQASTVRDSLESFVKYGNYNYHFIILQKGEIKESLEDFDGVIIHYSCIALPYRYYQPISAFSSMRIQGFKGIKLALVQDEQRAGHERLRFLNMLGVNHLFSVAEPDLYEILYPSAKREFSISTVLTGYISEDHINVAKQKIPLNTRRLDLVYRGRKLPDWMGKTGTIKSEIPEIIESDRRLAKFSYSVSSSEQARLYGESWYRFLQSARVSICTPSGSDFLDLDGKYPEAWIPNLEPISGNHKEPIAATYQMISPRFFDCVSAGNLISLTAGFYSNIPISKGYIGLSNDLIELPEILEFAKSNYAQKIVDNCQKMILGNEKLYFSYFVKLVEEKLASLLPVHDMQKRVVVTDKLNTNEPLLNRSHIIKQFFKFILKKINYFRINSLIIEVLVYIQIIRNTKIKESIITLRRLRILSLYDVFNPRIKREIFIIKKVSSAEYSSFAFSMTHFDKTYIKPVRHGNKILIEKAAGSRKSHWSVDLSEYGCVPVSTRLIILPKRANYDLDSFNKIVNIIN
jgi:hypothetical protein